MNKFIMLFSSLLLCITSCSRYNMLDGKSRPVYFTPDATVFDDSDTYKPEISYFDQLNIRGNAVNVLAFKKGITSKAIISQPTFFLANDIVLIFPGEHIIVSRGEKEYYNNYTFSKSKARKHRIKELSFFKNFHEIAPFPFKTYIENASLDTILALEKQLVKEISKVSVTSKIVFDSLTKAYRVSRKFKKITQNFIENEYAVALFLFYKQYKDTLSAHNLYEEKCKQLIPNFNAIRERSKFNGVNTGFNEFADVILPYKIWKVQNRTEFQSCFDSVKNNFSDLARDFLLSRLMYQAYTKRIEVSSDYREKYRSICSNKSYKKLVSNLVNQQQQFDQKASEISTNALITVNGKKVTSLEDIIAKNKGKLILFDFWTTWCAPCREEIPAWKKLSKEYAGLDITFVSISLDKEMQTWQKFVISDNTETKNHYLLINDKKSSFMKEHGISSIPRYILLDKRGNIADADAPRPSDPKITDLLNKFLHF